MLNELWSLRGRYKILHLSWFAFFLSFVVWFNLAPLATAIQEDMGLTVAQIRILAICNVALTVPARIIIGMVLDRFGPRITYSCLLVYAAIPCIAPDHIQRSSSGHHLQSKNISLLEQGFNR